LQIESMEIVCYTAIFLLPGYIVEEMIRVIMPKKQYSEGIIFLRYLAYSIINLAIWSWLYFLIMKYLGNATIVYWMTLVLATVISSLVTGTILGVIRKKECIRLFFSKCGLQVEHPIPTAWDYKFSEINDFRWVIINLVNDEIVYGKYANNSFTSSDESYRDIYLEEVYILDDENNWKLAERSDGIWISPNEIKSIEFKR